MDPTQQLAQGFQQMSLEQPQEQQQHQHQPAHQKKKKAARAYHNLTPNTYPTASPQPQFGSIAPPLASQNAGSPGIFTPGQSALSTHPTPQLSAPGMTAFTNGHQTPTPANTMSPATAARNAAQSQAQQQATQVPQGDTLSVPFNRRLAQEEFRTEPFKTYTNVAAPTATTRMCCIDQGTAGPKFARLTMSSVPESEALRAQTKLPLGLTVRPFAPLDSNEEPVPEVDLTSFDGPPRCRRCRTYLNPAMKFTHEQKFICNMCKFPNPVHPEYQCPLDHQGRRLDVMQRPELHKGVVDFIVPESYWVEDNKTPSPFHHLFLIDVSAPNEVISAATDAVRSALHDLPEGVKIGLMTYDQKIHFYNLESERPQVIVCSDLDDPFIPLYSGLFVDPSERPSEIHNTLSHIEDAYTQFKSPEVAYGAALAYALESLKIVGGGKVTATLSRLPTWGPGSLVNPNDKDMGSETFKCTNEFYQKLSDEYIKSNCGLDLFVISSAAVSLINSANVVFKTGGLLKLYSNFIMERDGRQLFEDMKRAIMNTRGYQAQLKVRCSNGLQVSSYYGNFEANGSQDPKLPILSSDQQICVLFNYDAKLSPGDDAHFQTALLYTGIDGKRRVRVINVVAAIAQDVATAFGFADQDAIIDIIIKNCLHYISKQHPTEVKNSVKDKVVDVLTQYRTLVPHGALMPSQLIFPDSLNTLPAFINSFQKSKVFRTAVQNNSKIYEYYLLNSLPLDRLMYQLYPALINLVELTEQDCTYDENGLFIMPENTRATSQFVGYGGAFFMFNGTKLYLWIHSDANKLLVEDLLGVQDMSMLPPTMSELPPLDTHINLQARNVVEYFRQYLGLDFLTVQLVRHRIDGAEFEFGDGLVEDRSLDKTESYQEFVTSVHRAIKEAVDNARAPKEHHSDADHDHSTLSQRFVQF